jgi:pimeloyl-ACP methyl ester carboxylesterase
VGEWREHPIFVPFGDGHIAAVVTTPRSSPRALVLLLTGWGATRSHRSRIWTRVARSLAESGFASARFDYPGIGDSTGKAAASMDDPPVGETLAVLDAARSITGDVDIAMVGNCIGALTAFSVAARVPECRAVVGIHLRKPGGIVVRSKESLGHSAAAGARRAGTGALKARPRLKRVVRKMLSPMLYRPLRFVPDVEAVLRSRACLLLFLGEREPAARLARDIARLTADSGRLARVQHLQTAPIVGFRIPLRLQPHLIEAIVKWLDAQLPGGSRVPAEPVVSTG